VDPCQALENGRVAGKNREGGSEDCAELQRFDTGKPAVNLAVAARYLHSHNSLIERRDLDHAVDLLVNLLPLLDAKTVAELSRF
jgi:endoglucanase